MACCEAVHKLRASVFLFASHFTLTRRVRLSSILPCLSSETCRYIECLVIPERTGEQFWTDLLTGPKLPTLVAALIGRALQEHVLGAPYFGGTAKQLRALEHAEQQQESVDGNDCERFVLPYANSSQLIVEPASAHS